ncbi:MAG TPA: LacI family DNA-binding transcriptional regulator, partial [Kineosporiaceae bacterium]|nr:LacI family DNA-binding transcriptional regulator [Kineosporiaceae bacterium]
LLMVEQGGGHRPTIADIARLAGVSKGAVSYALNGRPGVSDLTRSRVLRIAEELGWEPNSAARALSGSGADAIGLVLSRAPRMLGVEPFFMTFLAGLESELAPARQALLLQLVPDHETAAATYRRWWLSRRVDGVLVMDLFEHDSRVAALEGLGLPALAVGGPEGVGGLACLWSDDAAAMTAAVQYLAGLGHRRIARVGGPPQMRHTAVRTSAFHRIAADLGLTDVQVVDADLTDELGAAVTRTLLSSSPRPTAIVYDNDVMAVAGIGVAGEMGVTVPDQLSLLAWDDSPLCRLTHPGLSAMTRDVYGFGAQAGRLLLEVIAGQSVGAVAGSLASLTPRGSTGPPAG